MSNETESTGRLNRKQRREMQRQNLAVLAAGGSVTGVSCRQPWAVKGQGGRGSQAAGGDRSQIVSLPHIISPENAISPNSVDVEPVSKATPEAEVAPTALDAVVMGRCVNQKFIRVDVAGRQEDAWTPPQVPMFGRGDRVKAIRGCGGRLEVVGRYTTGGRFIEGSWPPVKNDGSGVTIAASPEALPADPWALSDVVFKDGTYLG